MIIARSAVFAAQKSGLRDSGSVVTIGNFDGVHIGHQAMLRAAREQADELHLPLVVLSFDVNRGGNSICSTVDRCVAV